MGKRIIVNMIVDYWNDGMRKNLMKFLIHNCQVITTDEDFKDHTDFVGVIIEPANPAPLIPVQEPDDKVFNIEW